jgi:hypothetical protein
MATGLKNKSRPAFYALREGSWRDYITLLHPPYTAWHLSYVVLGAAAAPHVYLGRTGGAVLAFFLGVGLAAHFLDEFHSRALRTRIPDVILLSIAAISLAGALAIGIIAAFTISLWIIPFLIFGLFSVIAYNLEILNSRFHSDLWFGVAWGAFPSLTGYWANAEQISVQAFLVCIACLLFSLAQRTLSRQVREIRRKSIAIQGQIEFEGGRIEKITTRYLLNVPEKALRLLTLTVILLAVGWLVARIW